jgi:hypothetical protein
MGILSDDQLARDALRGDKDAIEEIERRKKANRFRYAINPVTGSVEVVED